MAERLSQLHQQITAALREDGRTTRHARKLAAFVLSAVEGAYQLGSAVEEVMPAGLAAGEVKRAVRGLIASQSKREQGRK